MQAFRHTARKYAREAVELGRIRIGATGYYHNVENAPNGVADRMEFRTLGVHLPMLLKPHEHIALRLKLLEMGLSFPLGATVSLKGNKWEFEHPAGYILCLSKSEKPKLFGKQYDAVLQIADVEDLGKAIVAAMPDQIDRFVVREISYARRHFDVFVERLLPPDPFIKTPNYEWQQEIRLLFIPKGEVQQFIFPQSDDIKRAFKTLYPV